MVLVWVVFMKNKIQSFFVLVCLVSGSAYGAVYQNFSRYEIILQRRPFGEVPSEAELSAAARSVPVGPSFIDSLRMCAITDDGGGSVRVGFVDIKAKPVKTYFLFVGESEDGIEVVDADYEEEMVTLRKAGDERKLSMTGAVGAAMAVANKGSGRRSLHSRRAHIKRTRAQIKEARRLAIEKKKPILQGAEYEAHIRQYNLDQIRNGGIPLPIALSAEEDAQLVAEGILAPME